MRTTVTLDKDVEEMLWRAMHRSRKGFKETLNAALRAGLRRTLEPAKRRKFVLKAQSMALRPGIDPGGLNRLADDLEVEAVTAKLRSGK